MKKRIFAAILAAILALCMLPTAAFAGTADTVDISLKSPSGQSTSLTLPLDTTIAEVKEDIEEAFGINFDGSDGYRLYCSEVGFSNYKLDVVGKETLSDYGF